MSDWQSGVKLLPPSSALKRRFSRWFVLVFLVLIHAGLSLSLYPLSYAQNQQQFLDNFPDVPLIPGMQEDTEHSVSFDSPVGRFAQSYMVGIPEQKPLEFMRKTLPALGWSEKNFSESKDDASDASPNNATFTREMEQIIISVIENYDDTNPEISTVSVTLAPLS